MMSIFSRYFLVIILISYLNNSIEKIRMDIDSHDLNYLSQSTLNSSQTSLISIKSFPLTNSDCFCSYNPLINLLLCSPFLQNSSSFLLSSINISLINITLNDCTFSNNHFNLPKIKEKTIDHLHLNNINHQDYIVFDRTSFDSYSINHLSIIYTYIQPITILLFSNETFSLSLRTLHIDSCYLLTLNQPLIDLFLLESITLINIEQFSWYDFQQQIIHLPKLRWIYLEETNLLTTNNIFNVLSCEDLSSQWIFTYRLIQTCSCQFMTFLNSILQIGNVYQCLNSDQTFDFINNICQFNGQEYLIENQTNLFCNQCLSKQCLNGTLCGESYDSESNCLLLSRYDYQTIRKRIPLTSYTKQYLFQESHEYLSLNSNQTLGPNVFNSVATILIDSNRNQTEHSANDVRMFHQTLSEILDRPWSPQIYASTSTIWQDLILSLDESIKNMNISEDKFEFQSKPISTVSLLFPIDQQSSNIFGWKITNDNTITSNITDSESSNPNVTTRVFLQFNNTQSNTSNCTNRFSITSLKAPKLFFNTNRIPEYDVISIIAPDSNQHVTFYFDQKLPLNEQLNYSSSNTNNSIKLDSFYDQLDLMISEGSCMYLNTTNMIWQTDGCTTDRQLSNSTSVMCTCEHLTMFTVFFSLTCAVPSIGLEILSWIGCCLSIIGLFITLIMFIIINKCQRIKYLNNKISSTQLNSTEIFKRKTLNKSKRFSMVKSMLFVLCILLILMNIFIFILTFIKAGRNLTCTILSALLYYFTLTAFIWKFCFALQQSLFITNIFQPYWSNRILFIIYLILTFILPICPLIIMFIKYENFTFISSTCNYCWLTREFLLYGLIIPIIVIGCLNIVFYLYTIIYLCLKNREQPELRSTKSNHSRHIQNFKIGLFFAIIMGLSWILGFLVLIPNSYVQFFGNILFCIVNSIQGFAFSIMVFFILEKKSFRKCFCFWRYKNSMKTKVNKQDISTPQQIETTSNDDKTINIKNSINSSIYTLSTSSSENNNYEMLKQKLSTRNKEEEDEHIYTALPL